MTDLHFYKEYWLSFIDRYMGITRVILVRSEDELRDKIATIKTKEPFLVVVIPSSDTDSPDHDNIRERETCIIYLLIKVSRQNQTEKDIEADQIFTQVKISALKSFMLADAQDGTHPHIEMLRQIEFSSMHTDPEYNYLGCDGYSLSFTLITKGF